MAPEVLADHSHCAHPNHRTLASLKTAASRFLANGNAFVQGIDVLEMVVERKRNMPAK
jgi:hypothetical protein